MQTLEPQNWTFNKWKLVASEHNHAWASGLYLEQAGLSDWEIIRFLKYTDPNSMTPEDAFLHTDCVVCEYV